MLCGSNNSSYKSQKNVMGLYYDVSKSAVAITLGMDKTIQQTMSGTYNLGKGPL